MNLIDGALYKLLTKRSYLLSIKYNHKVVRLSKMLKTCLVRICCMRQYARGKNISNPGISRRMDILKKESPNLEIANIDEEVLENFETDLMNSSDLHNQYSSEISKIQKKINYSQIERKYFEKEKLPNMLLWSEKEQIRQLYNSDPSYWTVDRLSQSFPATKIIIMKIIKNQWKPSSTANVVKHDKRVVDNWNRFKTGRLKIVDKELSEHLKLFSERNIPVAENKGHSEIYSTNVPEPTSTEFVSILTTFEEKIKEKQEKLNTHNLLSSNFNKNISKLKYENDDTGNECDENLDELRRMYSIKHNKHQLYTLDSLRKVTELNLFKTEEDERFLKINNYTSNNTVSVVENNEEMKTEISKTDILVNRKNDIVPKYKIGVSDVNNEERIPSTISIPKDKFIVGATYKVNDCYYDFDGQFLYRVPGMTE